MCSNIPAEEFVETWMAYALSNLDGADPTIEYINQFERKELKTYTSQTQTKKPLSKTETTPVIYNRADSNAPSRGDTSSMDVLDVYATTPKVSHEILQRTESLDINFGFDFLHVFVYYFSSVPYVYIYE